MRRFGNGTHSVLTSLAARRTPRDGSHSCCVALCRCTEQVKLAGNLFSVSSSLEWAHDVVWNDTDDWETVSFSHGPNATLLILERHPVMGPRWPDEVIPVEVFPDVADPGARGLEAVPLHGENLRRQREERRVTADGD